MHHKSLFKSEITTRFYTVINMQKICFVIPSLQAGGMERVMTELVKYFLKKRNLELHLVLYGMNRTVFYSVPDEVIIHKPKFKFNNKRRLLSTVRTLFFLRKTIINIRPASILSFGEYWNSFVLLARFGMNVPVYVSDRCQPDKSLGIHHEFLRRFLYPKSAGVVAQTSIAKKIYTKKSLNHNIKVISNPIYKVSTKGVSGKENIVLTVGRLVRSKHHDRLIRIFKKVSRPGWKLVIVGGDALKENGMIRLKALVQELEMDDQVELPGTVSDIDSYYRKSKIFAFTSSSEGFPNVIGEAMSAKLPVIAYNCVAGPSDLISDRETGFLINLFDDTEYAERLKLLMVNADLRMQMGRQAQKKIKKFDIRNIAEEYYSFIKQ